MMFLSQSVLMHDFLYKDLITGTPKSVKIYNVLIFSRTTRNKLLNERSVPIKTGA